MTINNNITFFYKETNVFIEISKVNKKENSSVLVTNKTPIKIENPNENSKANFISEFIIL